MSVPASVITQTQGSGSLVAVDGRSLPLQATNLTAEASAGLARVVVKQTFHNPHTNPLHVTYQLPIPLEAVVSAFTFIVNDTRIVGEIDRREAARERFEQALADGHSAALLEEDRSTLFRQEVGNIPAGADVLVEIALDQRLTWVDGGWEWRFPTVVAPRYLGEPGRVNDAVRVQVDMADQPSSPPLNLGLAIHDALSADGQPSSPSHDLAVVAGEPSTRVEFIAEQQALDRDVVVRWPVAEPDVAVRLDTARPAVEHARSDEMFGLLTIQPPQDILHIHTIPRDVIVLLDTSGSMHGCPLDQAKAIVSFVVDSLGAHDRLELIEFSNRPNRWKRGATPTTDKTRRDAKRWLARLEASGATEMRSAVNEALHSLRGDAQRQVVLV
ncbi:MAG: VIT domain-containing protein, partial [Gammaproteobacteria bacterium]|nr:VIT domain-containing protein [Gammaproteobacteria bacterium]